jgi:hypothetical protein
MGRTAAVRPVLVVVGAFSRHDAALAWAKEKCEQRFGPIGLMSERFAFTETNYYDQTMGQGLLMQFAAFERLADPAELPDWKTETNGWEDEYAKLAAHEEERPLNLDPGYLTEAKLVLASTKDHHHRIYLRDGVYAEATLVFQSGQWRARDWTYPNYRRADYQEFFTRCRDYLRTRFREA